MNKCETAICMAGNEVVFSDFLEVWGPPFFLYVCVKRCLSGVYSLALTHRLGAILFFSLGLSGSGSPQSWSWQHVWGRFGQSFWDKTIRYNSNYTGGVDLRAQSEI